MSFRFIEADVTGHNLHPSSTHRIWSRVGQGGFRRAEFHRSLPNFRHRETS